MCRMVAFYMSNAIQKIFEKLFNEYNVGVYVAMPGKQCKKKCKKFSSTGKF